MKHLPASVQALLSRASLPIPRRATAHRQGMHGSPVHAAGVEFSEHRPYVEGDDIRYVDWAAFHRTGQLIVKRFAEDRNAKVVCLVDVSRSMNHRSASGNSKFERAKSLAASLGFVALRNYDTFELAAFSDATTTSEPRVFHHRDELPLLDALLSGTQQGGTTDFTRAARTAASRNATFTIVLTDLLSEHDFAFGLRALGAQGGLWLVHIHDKEDTEPETLGEVELVDAEHMTTERVRLTPALIAAYREEVNAHLAQCRSTTLAVGGAFHSVRIEDTLESNLLTLFSEGSAETYAHSVDAPLRASRPPPR